MSRYRQSRSGTYVDKAIKVDISQEKAGRGRGRGRQALLILLPKKKPHKSKGISGYSLAHAKHMGALRTSSTASGQQSLRAVHLTQLIIVSSLFQCAYPQNCMDSFLLFVDYRSSQKHPPAEPPQNPAHDTVVGGEGNDGEPLRHCSTTERKKKDTRTHVNIDSVRLYRPTSHTSSMASGQQSTKERHLIWAREKKNINYNLL